jgi:DNA polymerase I
VSVRPVLFLVDGYALIYRAFFAMIRSPLTTSRGENTSAVWGVANFLLRLLQKHRPPYVAWVHDAGSSFRHETFPEYKATREKLDAELQQAFDRSVERIETLLAAVGVRLVEVDGYEADDVIGTLAVQAADRGFDVVIVSGDKDFYQLLGEHITLLNPGRGGPAAVEEQHVTLANAADRLGVPPAQVVDFLALVGDSADNVPGVRGVGEKTAQKLLAEHGTLEAVLAHAADVPTKKVRDALLADADRARLSKVLVTIHRDVPVALDPPAFAARAPDWARLLELFTELEFRSLVQQVAARLEEAPTVDVPVDVPAAAYVVADTLEAVADAVRRARDARVVAIDCETTSIEPMRADLVGLSLAVGPGVAWYLPFAHHPSGDMLETAGVRNLPPIGDPALTPLRDLLADATVEKVGHNIKFDWMVLQRAGVALSGVAFDSMIASFMVDPGRRSHALDELTVEFFGARMRTYQDVVGRGKAERPFAAVPIREAADYCCADSDFALRLRGVLEPTLRDHGLEALFEGVEMPLIAVLAEMEREGIAIDRDLFARLTREFRQQLGEIERAIYQAAGTEFNVNSNPQLRVVLFDKLQLPVLKKGKTGPSTDADVLDELAAMGHEVPKLLLEYREVAKLLSTYLEALPVEVNPATGRIHTSFNQIGAATGRLSSTRPNLQNIPVRSARGESIRRGFVPRPGWRFVVADYSQIELRLLAHLSGDPAFVAAFRSGGDIHRQTAAIIFGLAPEEVSADMRARAKTINFATIYGQGARSLSRSLGIPFAEAQRFIGEYFERFSGVRAFLDRTVAEAREKGYVETIFGRRRYVPELRDQNFNVRAFGERVAANSPIQGSAADLIKVAMVRLSAALGSGSAARLLLQVHDELVVESTSDEAPGVAALVRREMEGAAQLSVPLVVDVGIGANWLDAKAAP